MTKLLIAALLAAFAASAQAEGSGRWFIDGVPWFQHPCGLPAYAKYGDDSRAQVRHNYLVTLRNPAMCAKLFP